MRKEERSKGTLVRMVRHLFDRIIMSTSNRMLLVALSAGAALFAAAQKQPVRPPQDQPDRNTFERRTPGEPVGIDGKRETSAGSPDAVRYPGDVAFPDSGLTALVLDPSQAERIRAMDARYADELNAMGNVQRTDPRYRKVWSRRSDEIQSILTPAQYDRWKQLNTPTTPMPQARSQGAVTPMPMQPADTTLDPMPVEDGTAPVPPR